MEIDDAAVSEKPVDASPVSKRPRTNEDESETDAEAVDLDPAFGHSIESEPLSRGAEATLTACVYFGRPAVLKKRAKKSYRHPVLDLKLTKERLKAEIRGIAKCKIIGVPCPALFFINEECHELILEQINGITLKAYLDRLEATLPRDVYLKTFGEAAVLLGAWVARMHLGNLIHGDLTSANVMLRNEDPSKMAFIDFGLSYVKDLAEDKAVDIYVFERALAALHDADQTTFAALQRGYASVDATHGEKVYAKVEEVRLRGRKRNMAG